ncbi:hypothetical protein MKZ38_001793 [Zalerion maritima]|uniref:Aminoacyl-transfer RNA synthetases class-II family profile domain-containing protein n=1 Tax=Zalerion maritima TaxID=339359 RepID=A0AAD5WWZ3_9PEZI|nr:hypothetical protein MKZ38_001793 [Zalerion maritima]
MLDIVGTAIRKPSNPTVLLKTAMETLLGRRHASAARQAVPATRISEWLTDDGPARMVLPLDSDKPKEVAWSKHTPASAAFPAHTLHTALARKNGLLSTPLQKFSWDPRCQPPAKRRLTKRGAATRLAFTREEDDLLIKLRSQRLRWKDIHEQYNKAFPQRERSRQTALFLAVAEVEAPPRSPLPPPQINEKDSRHQRAPSTARLDSVAPTSDGGSSTGVRREVLKSIATAKSTSDVTWIFTDQQSSSNLGSSSARDYQNAAALRGSPFISIIMHCKLDENLERAAGGDRGNGSNTKLTDLGILRSIGEREDIFHFKDEYEAELDVTHLSPSEAAALEKSFELRTRRFADIRGFKHEFAGDFHEGPPGREVRILCWLVGRPRHHGAVLFLPIGDSMGTIQVVAKSSKVPRLSELKALRPELGLMVLGSLASCRDSTLEIVAHDIGIISKATSMLHPDVRYARPSILESQNTDALLSHRHLYLRNPIILALNLYRSQCFSVVHEWFKIHKFVEISAPLITPSILYEANSAIHISNLKTSKILFLSQCAGFYLEAAAHAHERVYNLGPSFRNESRTNRHLMEYWHIKAELCSGEMNDIMDLVEIFIRHEISFGQNISKQAEDLLTDYFRGPVWLAHKPRGLEPFPHRIYPADEELTMTADLISSGGFGEICGVAEKSFTREDLELRLKEKGKSEMQDVYGWVLQSRDFGIVPHTAFGRGFERVLRWFCGVAHVKDMIPFPRIFGRDPTP